ncbi:nuclear pore complex protein Nup93-1 [Drosophila grimshawi]|uniref:Nuclear pore protein n=1 Tax=Drosophila grimshawi TaxID=7222 RepID=B4JHU7_DROGR|nr:nuclear pore complex protein Nup93-1 [Drosophila grimshawi]EDV92855.1 GH18990 [Drosophila grimshawi]
MDLNTLLQQAQSLTTGKAEGELPGVERTLQQVLQSIEQLHSHVTQTGTKEIQAQILLGSKGINLSKLNKKLETLSTGKTFEPLDVAGADTDVCTFLKNERENAIFSVIEETNKNISDSVSKRKWENLTSSWNEEKTRLLEALIGPSQNFIDLQRLPEQTILNPECLPLTCLDDLGLQYAQELGQYNALLLKGGSRPNLVQKYAQLANSTFGNLEVTNMWLMLSCVTQVNDAPCLGDPIKTRQQRPEFVLYAKQYLEHRYRVYMNKMVNIANRDDSYRLVRAHVERRFSGQQTIGLVEHAGGQPLWPLIYYSLRCGAVETAVEFLNEAGSSYDDFAQLIADRNGGVVNSKIESQLKLQYANKIRNNSTDAFKKAVYCTLLNCDINDTHSEVAKTIDDFLWIRLSMLHPGDATSYAQLQSIITTTYGEEYFDALHQPYLYFQALALTGQFEAAIEFLFRTDANRVHAVHMAIALHELGMLGGVRSVSQPLLTIDISDPTPLRRLNLARLIRLYVERFEGTDTAEALHYYYTLRNLHDPKGRNMFLKCVCDLVVNSGVLDTSIFASIFGQRQTGLATDDDYSGGLFRQFSCADFDTPTMAGLVADELIARGNFEMAVRLYDMAGNLNLALKYISILLAQVVQQPAVEGTLRARLSLEAERFSTRLPMRQTDVEPKVSTSFTLLRELLKFFDKYHEGKLLLALQQLERIPDIIPNSTEDVSVCMSTFRRLSGEVIKVIPDVMVAAMDITLSQYKQLKLDTESGCIIQQQLRERAKAIANMAATMPYCPTNQRLLQLELLMH